MPAGARRRRAAGVGVSGRDAKVLHALWFMVQAPPGLLCLGLLVFGTWAHVVGYSPGDPGPAATFVETLRARPGKARRALTIGCGCSSHRPSLLTSQRAPIQSTCRSTPASRRSREAARLGNDLKDDLASPAPGLRKR